MLEIKSLFVNKFKQPKGKGLASVMVELGLAGGGSVWLRQLTLVDAGEKGKFIGFPAKKIEAAEEAEGGAGPANEAGDTKAQYEEYFFWGKDHNKEIREELLQAVLAKYGK